MGFFDKIKNAVTGGAAKVEVETEMSYSMPGVTCWVKITVTSTGSDLKSGGVFFDIVADESVSSSGSDGRSTTLATRTSEQVVSIAPAFVLAAGESRVFQGEFTIPGDALPTYRGRNATHLWQVRGRVEMVGNDPDSGWLPLKIIDNYAG